MPAEMTKLEKLEQKQTQIQNQIKAEKRRLSSENRKARNHALMVIGGLVEAQIGDWREIDWDKLALFLKRNNQALQTVKGEKLETREAAERLRAWERAARKKAEG